MIRAVSVVGFHGAGKTRVVEGLVRELTRRKRRVGTVKHITELDFTIDQPGKDTWLHARAGAKLVVSVAPREVARIERRAAKLDDILRGLYGLDFVIVEGFREFKGLPKIVVAQSRAEASKLVDGFTIACVGAKGLRVPTFGFGQLKRLADLVERRVPPVLPGINCEHCGYKSCREFALAVVTGKQKWDGCPTLKERVTLSVDERRVYLNPFMQDLVAGLIRGLLSSLKGAKGRKVELKVVSNSC